MLYRLDANPDRFSFENILKENFQDKNSILISDKFLNNLTESQKFSLADKMGYTATKSTRRRLDRLNRKKAFLDLPATKGNITKSVGYKPTKECLSLLKTIMTHAKGKNTTEGVSAFHSCETAMSNLEKNIKYFQRAYETEDTANIMVYQSIGAALIEFTSIVLINCTTFTEQNMLIFRDPPKGSLSNNILFKSLEKFNDICRNNKLKLNEKLDQELEEYEMVYNEGLMMGLGAVGIGAAAVLGGVSLLIGLIYLTRVIICYYYFKKTELSENLEFISGMIHANSVTVSNGSPRDKKVGERQTKLANRLLKLGEKLDSDSKQAQMNAINELKKEDSETSDGLSNNINPDYKQNEVEAEYYTSNALNSNSEDLFI